MDGHPHHLIHGRPFYGQPPPPLQQPPSKSKAERPSSLGSVIGIHPAPNSQSLPPVASQQVKSGGKRTRWLLCYPAGGAASSESPSPPSEACSNVSTPSPTDHGFKIPNSQSNERPTSLPVALLNSARANGDSTFFFFVDIWYLFKISFCKMDRPQLAVTHILTQNNQALQSKSNLS